MKIDECDNCKFNGLHSDQCGSCGDISHFVADDIVSVCENCSKLKDENDMLFASILMSKRAEAEYWRLKKLKGKQ